MGPSCDLNSEDSPAAAELRGVNHWSNTLLGGSADVCDHFWPPQGAVCATLCWGESFASHAWCGVLWPRFVTFGGINGTCFLPNPCFWWHSHNEGRGEGMLCPLSSSAGFFWEKKLLLDFRWGSVPFRGKGVWHVCVCSHGYRGFSTTKVIIYIDLFAFHSELFHVATWKMISLKAGCSTELVLTSKNQGEESKGIKMINCCISMQPQSVFCFTDCLFLRVEDVCPRHWCLISEGLHSCGMREGEGGEGKREKRFSNEIAAPNNRWCLDNFVQPAFVKLNFTIKAFEDS